MARCCKIALTYLGQSSYDVTSGLKADDECFSGSEGAIQLKREFSRHVAERFQLVYTRRDAVQKLVGRRRPVLAQQRQHSPHQNNEKSVQRSSHVAPVVGFRRRFGIDVGITAVSVSLVGVVVEAKAHEEVDEDVGVLLVEKAVCTNEHLVKVTIRMLD